MKKEIIVGAALIQILTGCVAVSLSSSDGVNGDVAEVSELLSIPSVSRSVAENDRAIEWMKEYLESHGVWCAVERFPKDGRKILYAATKPGLKKPDYTFITHLDVVDAPEAQFKPVIKDGRIYARGACDTKIQAFCGAKALIALNGKGSVGCVFSSDEETSGSTTKYMVSLGYGEPQKACVVLDAGNFFPGIRYCCKGNAYYKVTAIGKSGHSSRPDLCENPHYMLAEAMLKIRDEYPHQKPGEWKNFASVTIIGGGDSQNRIPETAEMTVNVRFTETEGDPLETERKLIEKITGLKTEFIRGTPAAVSDPTDPQFARMQRLMKKHYPERDVQIARGDAANDSRYFNQFHKPMLGVSMNCDAGHTDAEWCQINDIPNYCALLTEFCSH